MCMFAALKGKGKCSIFFIRLQLLKINFQLCLSNQSILKDFMNMRWKRSQVGESSSLSSDVGCWQVDLNFMVWNWNLFLEKKKSA